MCSRGHRPAGRDSVNAVRTGSSHRNTGRLDGWPSHMTPLLLPFSCQPVAPSVDTPPHSALLVIFSHRDEYKYKSVFPINKLGEWEGVEKCSTNRAVADEG